MLASRGARLSSSSGLLSGRDGSCMQGIDGICQFQETRVKNHPTIAIADGKRAVPAAAKPKIYSRAARGRAAMLVAGGAAMLCATGTSVFAQQCSELTGEASASSREAALNEAFEAVLQIKDRRSWQAWLSGGRKFGDAPGYVVRKLTSQCSPGRAGQTCRVTVLLCAR